MNVGGGARPSIEFVLPSLAVAGMERVVAQMSIALRDRDFPVGITCVDAEGEMAPGLRAEGVRVTVVPTAGLRAFVWPAALRRWFEEIEPAVVHIHNVPWFKAALAARQARVPVVVLTQHGQADNDTWVDRLLDGWAARMSDRITTVSAPLSRYVIESLGAAPDKVLLVPNGVDVDEFSPSSSRGRVRAELGLRSGEPVVGMVARLEPIKNHDCMLRAFAQVVAEHPEARLLLVGEGQLRDSIERRIQELGLTNSTVMSGQRSDVADVHRDLDVYVLPSLSEGASLSVLEAMASGVCIVASEVGGTPELLDHGSCGLLVPPDDPDALARAIGRVLSDAELRGRLAAAARRRCLERYASTKAVEEYERLYLEVTRSRTRG